MIPHTSPPLSLSRRTVYGVVRHPRSASGVVHQHVHGRVRGQQLLGQGGHGAAVRQVNGVDLYGLRPALAASLRHLRAGDTSAAMGLGCKA